MIEKKNKEGNSKNSFYADQDSFISKTKEKEVDE